MRVTRLRFNAIGWPVSSKGMERGGGGGGVGGGGGGVCPDPAFPLLLHDNPASRTSAIANPNTVSFPIPHPMPRFGRNTLPE